MISYRTLLDDQDLFDAFRRGDERAFMEVYQAFKRPIYVTTVKIVGSPEDAEDLTVQAFTSVWERRAAIQSMAHLKNFLFIAARNSAINFLHANRRSHLQLTPGVADEIDTKNISDPDTDQLFADLVEDILAIVETMPTLRGLVFRMRYLEERSVKEVAETLQLGVQSVYGHTKEALTQIREALSEKTTGYSKVHLLPIFIATAALLHSLH